MEQWSVSTIRSSSKLAIHFYSVKNLALSFHSYRDDTTYFGVGHLVSSCATSIAQSVVRHLDVPAIDWISLPKAERGQHEPDKIFLRADAIVPSTSKHFGLLVSDVPVRLTFALSCPSYSSQIYSLPGHVFIYEGGVLRGTWLERMNRRGT